nr:hypothetical protein [Pseudoclavibacter sp. Marseille-Q3772]
MEQTRVVIAEPQALTREAYSLILSAVDDIQVVAQTDSVTDAIDLIDRHRPDVLCLAVRLTDGDARDVIASIRDLRDPAPFILLFVGRKDAELVDSLRISDGVAVRAKYSPPEAIVRSVREAAARARDQHRDVRRVS